jgi:hypothetical protein
VEVKRIVESYNVGRITPDHHPETIAKIITEMLSGTEYETWKANTRKAVEELTWEKEEEKIKAVYSQFL